MIVKKKKDAAEVTPVTLQATAKAVKTRGARRGAAKAAASNQRAAEVQATKPRIANAGAANPLITVAIPCYNEEAILDTTYKRIKRACEAQGLSYEIIFGNDGSSDRTLKMLKAFASADSHVRVTSHYPNRGAGYTYREMWAAARGDIIIHMDADLAMPAEVALPALLTPLKDSAEVAIGSRYVGVKADYPLKRRIFSKGYIMLGRCLFRLDVNDTQTGFIAFYRNILPALDPRADGFEILVEIIAQAKAAGFRVAEVGLPWFHDTTSGETQVWSESLKILVGTLRVRRRFSRFKFKRRTGGASECHGLNGPGASLSGQDASRVELEASRTLKGKGKR